MIFSLQSGKCGQIYRRKGVFSHLADSRCKISGAESYTRDIRYHDYVSLDDVEPVGDSDVKSRLFDEEEMLEFQKLLEILSEEDRQIFTALFWHEKSYEEVGQEMNMPVDRVYSRVSRGKKKLKKNNRWLGGSI